MFLRQWLRDLRGAISATVKFPDLDLKGAWREGMVKTLRDASRTDAQVVQEVYNSMERSMTPQALLRDIQELAAQHRPSIMPALAQMERPDRYYDQVW